VRENGSQILLCVRENGSQILLLEIEEKEKDARARFSTTVGGQRRSAYTRSRPNHLLHTHTRNQISSQ